MVAIVGTGIGVLKSSLRELKNRVKDGFKLSANTPKILSSANIFPTFTAHRISEGLDLALGQVNANLGQLRNMNMDKEEIRYVVDKLRDLKFYFDSIIAGRGKLPEESTAKKLASLATFGYYRGGKVADLNETQMMPHVEAILRKFPFGV